MNHTMDVKTDWQKTYHPPIDDYNTWDTNFICHSDGGTRGESCSAIGWLIEAIVVRGELRHVFVVAMAGKFLSSPVSSFLAETMALDDAISFLTHLIRSSCVNTH